MQVAEWRSLSRSRQAVSLVLVAASLVELIIIIGNDKIHQKVMATEQLVLLQG